MEESSARRPTLIFLHLPKTAGTTLRKVFQRQYPGDQTYWVLMRRGGTAAFRSLPVEVRGTFRAIVGHVHFGLHEYVPGPATYFTMLRDPVQRVLSAYHWFLRTPDHPLHAEVVDSDLGSVLERGVSGHFDNLQTRMLSGLGEKVVYGACTRQMLEVAKENIREHGILMGLVERFDESLILARRRFGWNWRNILYRRHNVTYSRPQVNEYSDRSLTLIREYNLLDVELWRWAIDRFAAEVREEGPDFAAELRRFQRANRVLGQSGLVDRAHRAVSGANKVRRRIRGARGSE